MIYVNLKLDEVIKYTASHFVRFNYHGLDEQDERDEISMWWEATDIEYHKWLTVKNRLFY